MLNLDLRTIALIMGAVSVLQAIVLALYYFVGPRYHGVQLMVWAGISNALGFVLLIPRGSIPDALSIIVANAALFVSMLLLHRGINQFVERPRAVQERAVRVLIIAATLLLLPLTYVMPSVSIRTVIISVTAATIYLLIGWNLARATPPDLRLSYWFTASAFGLFGAWSFVRAGLTATAAPLPSLFTPTALQITAFLIVLVTITLWVAGLVAMCTQRMLRDLRLVQASERALLEDATRAAHSREELFRLTFDQAPIGASMVTLDHGYIRINDALCEITGYERDELFALGFLAITPPNDQDADFEHSRALVDGDYSRVGRDKRYIRKDKQVVWVHVTTNLVRDEQDQPQYFLNMVEDISERKQAEDAVRRLAEQRQQMLHIAQSLVADLSADTVIARLREALPAIIHHTWFGLFWLDEAAGVLRPAIRAADQWHGGDFTDWTLPLDQGICGAVARSGRAELVNTAERDPRSMYPPGATVTCEHLIAVPLHAGTSILGVLALSRDADPPFDDTEFELMQFLAGYAALAFANARLFEQVAHSEARARDREAMLSALGDNLPNGVIYQLIRDSEESFHYTYVSARAEQFGGLTPAQLYAEPMRLSTLIVEEDRERYRAAMREAFRSSAAFDLTVRRRLPSGEVQWQHICNQPRLLADGQIVWDGLTLDITERKQAEQALQHANRELRQRVIELSALNQIAQAITQWIDLPTALQAVGTTMAWLFDRASVGIWQLHGQRSTLARLAAVAAEETLPGGPTLALADDPGLERMLARGQPKVFAPTARLPLVARPPHLPAERMAGGCMLLPLQSRGQPIGLICIRATRPERVYTPSDVALAQTIAGTLANAIENTRLFAQAQLAAAEEERRRLSRDLHDSVSQALFHANMTAGVLPQLWEANPESGRRALGDLQQMTQSAFAEMRMLLVELRPAALIGTPLHELLKTLSAAISAKSGITFELTLDAAPLLPPDVQIALYRIAQEALNNMLKHAQAQHVQLALQVTPERTDAATWRGDLALRIADDGCGFDSANMPNGRLGMGSMHERAAGVGATLEITSQPKDGTCVDVLWRGSAVDMQEDV